MSISKNTNQSSSTIYIAPQPQPKNNHKYLIFFSMIFFAGLILYGYNAGVFDSFVSASGNVQLNRTELKNMKETCYQKLMGYKTKFDEAQKIDSHVIPYDDAEASKCYAEYSFKSGDYSSCLNIPSIDKKIDNGIISSCLDFFFPLITMEDCNKLSGKSFTEACRSSKATLENYRDVCGSISDPLLSDFCWTRIAEEAKDSEICNNIKFFKDACISSVSKKSKP